MKFNTVKVDPDLIDIIPVFLENTVKDCDALGSFIKASDLDGVSKVSHRILGTAKSYGFDQLDEIVSQMQVLAKEENISKLPEQYELLVQYIDFIHTDLKSNY